MCNHSVTELESEPFYNEPEKLCQSPLLWMFIISNCSA